MSGMKKQKAEKTVVAESMSVELAGNVNQDDTF